MNARWPEGFSVFEPQISRVKSDLYAIGRRKNKFVFGCWLASWISNHYLFSINLIKTEMYSASLIKSRSEKVWLARWKTIRFTIQRRPLAKQMPEFGFHKTEIPRWYPSSCSTELKSLTSPLYFFQKKLIQEHWNIQINLSKKQRLFTE